MFVINPSDETVSRDTYQQSYTDSEMRHLSKRSEDRTLLTLIPDLFSFFLTMLAKNSSTDSLASGLDRTMLLNTENKLS